MSYESTGMIVFMGVGVFVAGMRADAGVDDFAFEDCARCEFVFLRAPHRAVDDCGVEGTGLWT